MLQNVHPGTDHKPLVPEVCNICGIFVLATVSHAFGFKFNSFYTSLILKQMNLLSGLLS